MESGPNTELKQSYGNLRETPFTQQFAVAEHVSF
jgi:hypothetical protein